MRGTLKSHYKYSALAILVITAFVSRSYAEDDYTFDDSFIKGTHSKIDLSQYIQKDLPEGTYSLDIYLNNKWKGRYDMEVKRNPMGKIAVYYTTAQLSRFGIKVKKLNGTLSENIDSYASLSEWSNDDNVSESIDKGNMRVNISIPQIYENLVDNNYVDSSLWDEGIPALNLGWNGNISNSHSTEFGASDRTNGYLGLNASASIGGWSLKHRGNINWDDKNGSEWNSNSTYLERPIPGITSLASVGQISSTGEFLDSVTVRGLSLKSDVSMYPDSMSLFKPEIRGNAATNAIVTVRQAEKVVYKTTVPPGPFILTDYYPTSYSNDLDVTIEEANGSTSSFSVPYNTGAKLLHPGLFKYELVAGKLDGDWYYERPIVYQGMAEYGFNNIFTGYAGTSGFNSKDSYQSYLLGLGFNTPVGALSFDVTNARSHTSHGDSTGNMYRTAYSRHIDTTNTTLSLSQTQYSSKGYYSLSSALSSNGRFDYTSYNQKSSVGLSISQGLSDGWGSLYANGRFVEHWDKSGYDKQYQVSYGNSLGRARYNLSVQKVYNSSSNRRNNEETRIGFNISIPFNLDKNNTVMATSNTVFTNSHHSSTTASLSGTSGEYHQFNYGVTGNIGDSKSVSLNAGMLSPYASVSGAYSQGSDYRQTTLSGSGSVVAHSGGVTLTPESGDTLAIVEAKGAKGAKVSSNLGSTIDGNGYAVVTYIRPYRINSIEIDPKGSGDNVYFSETIKQVAPYSGSVVKVVYNTKVQDNLMFYGVLNNGKPFPFGATVNNKKGEMIGSVGQGGTVFITDASSPEATIAWKDGSCAFTLPKENNQEVTCQ